ncbi:MvaI/BcnI family restriction endonuclease [Rhizobium sp. BT03]|uniref:MvaI/BcnI family restriction endonuclease n=1 Tax=Rhizobium sp. BT03 TaxID=3045156 RepID=UPI0024B3D3FE|nr:MvaI/BcnI family restriction endonuclease [Rhizobium sp. BT03]WHO72766.1 MvaI/BcnI restriction endonuclease family protein [Rhizobium sp. BT03]
MHTLTIDQWDTVSSDFTVCAGLSDLRSRTIDEILSERLFGELHRIHRLGPIAGMRLGNDGQSIHHHGTNAGGYALEALLRIRPNGRPAPDFEGWEIKAHGVRDFSKPGNALLSLLSVGPTGGFYREEGPEAFIRRFGYAASNGYPGKLNLYTDHFVGQRNTKTGLTLHLIRNRRHIARWFDPLGALVLSADDGLPAAIWHFTKLAEHWGHKHARAAYVPYVRGGWHGCRAFHYGHLVQIGEGTDFHLFLDMLAAGRISYDPSLSLVGADDLRCRVRRRGQFRIHVGDLPGLYEHFTTVDVRRAPIAVHEPGVGLSKRRLSGRRSLRP